MPIYTYTCECGYSFDKRAGMDEESVPCTVCECKATRNQVYVFGVSGFARTPVDQIDRRQSFKDFTEASAELEYKHSRLEEAAGRTLATPHLATIAKAKAEGLRAKGVKSSADL